MQHSIRFLLGHELQEISACDPQTTVLDWLRGKMNRKGTKEGCAEGDCGACTVTVVELQDGQLRYQAINSCIQLLPMLDGKQLITVEDLASAEPRNDGPNPGLHPQLHPVQQAMVEQHGSQCGFCTPGFVMSLFSLFHDPRASEGISKPDRHDIDEVLAGNLCRCTGYAPIVKAARQALQHASAGDSFTTQETATILKLQQIAHSKTLALDFEDRRFFAPRTLDTLCRLLSEYPSATLLAGATDVGLWITKQLQQPQTLIYVGEVQELRRIQLDAITGELEIGAAVRYVDALEMLISIYPEMAELLKRFGAKQVRNSATTGGNIANGSPIGDMPPALIALGARLILTSIEGPRELPLEDFFIEYGKQDLRAGECVKAIRIPQRPEGLQYAVYKLSRRFDQDISSLCAAFSMHLVDGKVTEPRICFGGMAGRPLRARNSERALAGQDWNQDTVSAAQQALQQDYQPLSDWRGSREYRMQAAQNLLQRFYLETQNVAGTRLQRGVA